MKTSLIIGFRGQDGSFLKNLLSSEGHNLILATSNLDLYNSHFSKIIQEKIKFTYLDVRDKNSINHTLTEHNIDNIFNFATEGGVGYSFTNPGSAFAVHTLGVFNILDSIIELGLENKVYYFQALSGEIFGETYLSPHNELSPIKPLSPYATAKANAFNLCNLYREVYGLKIGSGLLFNHESEIRPSHYVTKKIVKGLIENQIDSRNILELGSLDFSRDWIFAGDAIRAINLMAKNTYSGNLIIAGGVKKTIQDFVEKTMEILEINKPIDEIVVLNREFLRKKELVSTFGDSTKIRQLLNWQIDYTFEDLIKRMIYHELNEQSTLGRDIPSKLQSIKVNLEQFKV